MNINYWSGKNLDEIFEKLSSGYFGISKQEAVRRLKIYGYNKLPESKKDSYFIIFIRQFQSPLIYILFAAAFLVLFIGELTDSLIIFFVLIFNAIFGMIQEGKAQNTLSALKKITETKSYVYRDGEEVIVPSGEVVPGDVLFLQEGEKISADARVIEANNLKVEEAILTGESEPVYKFPDAVKRENISLIDAKNLVFKGTHVVSGNGKAIVVATGLDTFIGGISKQIERIDVDVPLKKNIKKISRFIIFAVFLISIILFLGGIITGRDFKEMLFTIISLSVSIVPEGLPVVVTLILSIGAWNMSLKKVLIKRLQAVDALGKASIIAVDKTGTITKNEMMVERVYINGKIFNVEGDGYELKGSITLDGDSKKIEIRDYPEIVFASKMAAFCAGAKVIFNEKSKEWNVVGDPTEAALFVFAERFGENKEQLEKQFPFVGEIPFDYKLKYHATIHKENNNRYFLAVSGAPEKILHLSSKLWKKDNEIELNDDQKKELENIFLSFSRRGMRVLAFAFSRIGKNDLKIAPERIKDLTFVGFFGIKDPLRKEVLEAVKSVEESGVKVVLITGDHKVTAEAIGREAKIFKEGDLILTGEEVDNLPYDELCKKLPFVSVFARVTPENKLKIINIYRSMGETIAMTGDGVNDALSLTAADLGIAMGKIGTEVAKESSDLILLDDNFGNIVYAMEEGRSIYKTIKKVISYLFSTSLGEVVVISTAIFLGYPLPLLPSQIIWLNFVTDGFLTVAMGMEPKEKELLKANKKGALNKEDNIVDKLMITRMLIMGFCIGLFTLLVFNEYVYFDYKKAITISLTTLAVFQWFNALNCRHEEKSIFKMDPFSNKFLLVSLLVVFCLQFLAIYNPFLQKILHTTELSLKEWLLVISVSLLVILFEELRKYFYRKRKDKFV